MNNELPQVVPPEGSILTIVSAEALTKSLQAPHAEMKGRAILAALALEVARRREKVESEELEWADHNNWNDHANHSNWN